MIHKCSKHGLFDFGQIVPECSLCGKKMLFFCTICECWLSSPHTHRYKNKYTEEYVLFVYFNDAVSKVAIDKMCSVGSLKRLICTDLKLNPSQYYLTPVDNIPCSEIESVVLHFYNYGFAVLNKRNWINSKISEFADYFVSNDYKPL